eukprot:m.724376 g.724376  ORF g.724376 m.724376 type:complete len:247 (+) comp23024_c0_seq34:261-1001(+)
MGNCAASPRTTETNTNASRNARGSSQASAPAPIDPAAADIGDGKPLQEEARWNAAKPVTKEEIDAKRREFWSTAPAYEGRQEVWDALKAACESTDLELARSILASAEVHLPNGSMVSCFDPLGVKYSIPRYCIRYPDNLAPSKSNASAAPPAPAPVSPPKSSVQGSANDGIEIKIRLSIGKDITSMRFAETDAVDTVLQMVATEVDLPKESLHAFYLGKSIGGAVPVGALGLDKNNFLQLMVVRSK